MRNINFRSQKADRKTHQKLLKYRRPETKSPISETTYLSTVNRSVIAIGSKEWEVSSSDNVVVSQSFRDNNFDANNRCQECCLKFRETRSVKPGLLSAERNKCSEQNGVKEGDLKELDKSEELGQTEVDTQVKDLSSLEVPGLTSLCTFESFGSIPNGSSSIRVLDGKRLASHLQPGSNEEPKARQFYTILDCLKLPEPAPMVPADESTNPKLVDTAVEREHCSIKEISSMKKSSEGNFYQQTSGFNPHSKELDITGSLTSNTSIPFMDSNTEALTSSQFTSETSHDLAGDNEMSFNDSKAICIGQNTDSSTKTAGSCQNSSSSVGELKMAYLTLECSRTESNSSLKLSDSSGIHLNIASLTDEEKYLPVTETCPEDTSDCDDEGVDLSSDQADGVEMPHDDSALTTSSFQETSAHIRKNVVCSFQPVVSSWCGTVGSSLNGFSSIRDSEMALNIASLDDDTYELPVTSHTSLDETSLICRNSSVNEANNLQVGKEKKAFALRKHTDVGSLDHCRISNKRFAGCSDKFYKFCHSLPEVYQMKKDSGDFKLGTSFECIHSAKLSRPNSLSMKIKLESGLGITCLFSENWSYTCSESRPYLLNMEKRKRNSLVMLLDWSFIENMKSDENVPKGEILTESIDEGVYSDVGSEFLQSIRKSLQSLKIIVKANDTVHITLEMLELHLMEQCMKLDKNWKESSEKESRHLIDLITNHLFIDQSRFLKLECYGLYTFFNRVNRGDQLSTEDQIQFEWLRFITFHSYQGNGNAVALARNGFYHNHEDGPNYTRCFACDVRYWNWEMFDNVEETHRRISPHCPMHEGNGTLERPNIPIEEGDTARIRSRQPSSMSHNTTSTSTSVGTVTVATTSSQSSERSEAASASNRPAPEKNASTSIPSNVFVNRFPAQHNREQSTSASLGQLSEVSTAIFLQNNKGTI